MDVEHDQLKSRQHHQTYAKVGMGRGHEESAPMRCGVGKGCACDMVSICRDWDRRVVVVEVGCVVVENHCLNCQRCREHQVYWNHSLNRSLNHSLLRHDENDAAQLVKRSLNHSLNHSQCRRGENETCDRQKIQSYHHEQKNHSQRQKHAERTTRVEIKNVELNRELLAQWIGTHDWTLGAKLENHSRDDHLEEDP